MLLPLLQAQLSRCRCCSSCLSGGGGSTLCSTAISRHTYNSHLPSPILYWPTASLSLLPFTHLPGFPAFVPLVWNCPLLHHHSTSSNPFPPSANKLDSPDCARLSKLAAQSPCRPRLLRHSPRNEPPFGGIPPCNPWKLHSRLVPSKSPCLEPAHLQRRRPAPTPQSDRLSDGPSCPRVRTRLLSCPPPCPAPLPCFPMPC